MTSVNPQIFREYDIRGVVGEDLTPEVVRLLGRAFGTYMVERGGKDLVVGRDCRLSSEDFRDALVEGILSTGCSVTDIGVCPTPVYYFSLFHLKKEGGMMITASHNPPEFNGFKVSVGNQTIFGEELQNLRRRLERGGFARGRGMLSAYEIIEPYMECIRNDISLARPVKVVVDGGNGTAGPIVTSLLKSLGCQVVELYCEMDGRFPHHHPDPTVPEFLKDLIARVAREKAEVGLAYDGDGDRLGVIDRGGEIIWGDRLLILFAREILKSRPGAVIISEVKASQTLYDDISRHGGKPLMWKTGHSLIKQKMKETAALLAGEMSGHLFFADRYFGYDDAIYASCRLLEILARYDKGVLDLIADVPRTESTPEIRIPCPEEKKFRIVEGIRDHFSRDHEVIDIDGARIVFRDGWGLVRASNTGPILVLRFEARDVKSLEAIREEVESRVERLLAET
ncbi:MAG: phosphomannomutase/phosphoglucomutase [Deltaproteobacteria bacterium]|nr:phosphomannomutase/phosphoglucomutase [Deltaproteobacteria bacterium]